MSHDGVWWMLIMRCYPGPYKYHEAPSRLSQRRQSCEESELLLLETVWTPGSGVTMPPPCPHQPPHTGNLTNIWSCCESKVSLIIGSAFFLYKLFPVRWAAAGCLHGRSFSSSEMIGTLGSILSYLLKFNSMRHSPVCENACVMGAMFISAHHWQCHHDSQTRLVRALPCPVLAVRAPIKIVHMVAGGKVKPN